MIRGSLMMRITGIIQRILDVGTRDIGILNGLKI